MLQRYLMQFDSAELEKEIADFLVIGSGIAGLLTALRASESGDVIILTKKDVLESNTVYAQGGIAAAIGEEDSPELHFKDTLKAGAGLCEEEAVKVMVNEGPKGIKDLISLGVNFDRWGDRLALTREGAHSKRRILHARGDASGREIMRALSERVRENPRIKIWEGTSAIDLLTKNNTCYGAVAYVNATAKLKIFLAQATILATGGIGQLYEVTTNPEVATGNGIAMAYRAGAELVDMEFVQFHPTAFCYPEAPHFLISEAVRGEGAYLRDKNGDRFMPQYHELGELAPRDIVSRAIVSQMEKTKSKNVFLDLRHLDPQLVERRFPNIQKNCAEYGLDILNDLIPVAPAAHYMMGGVKTDIWGKTSLERLYACGEVACTGIHGANRLASNSLLEGLVFGVRVAQAVERILQEFNFKKLVDLEFSSQVYGSELPTDGAKEIELIRQTMTEKVGIVRSRSSLEDAQKIWGKLSCVLGFCVVNMRQIDLMDMLLVASLITEGALIRQESRGGHYRLDYPNRNDREWLKDIILKKSLVEVLPNSW